MARPNEEMDTRDALSNSAGASADPRPTSVNDSRTQPEAPQADDDDRLPIDAGATRTAAFDEGSEPRDEHRSNARDAEADRASRH